MDRHTAHSSSAFDEPVPSSAAPPLRLVPTPPASSLTGTLPSSSPAGPLWEAICAGTLRVAALRQEERDTRVVLQRHSFAPASQVKQRGRQILELVLQGNTECAIAIDLRLAASTVSHELKQALVSLGLGARLSAVPLPIAQLYHAAASNLMLESCPAAEPGSLIVVLPRPEQGLGLAPTELLVCQMMLAGNTHAEIAATRRRSIRTIANQLASIFAKLRVSGRLELLSFLASRQSELPAATAPSYGTSSVSAGYRST